MSAIEVPFRDVVTTHGALRGLYREPHALALRKKLDHLDEGCRGVIAAASFVLMATSDADGRCDVSPRGGPPGFVRILDDRRLAIPDLNGNNLLDSLGNLVDNPRLALLFVVPGHDETLRVEGRAWITTDPEILDGFTELRRPRCAVGVAVEQAFMHCAKAFRRGGVWDPASWPVVDGASPLHVMAGHCGIDLPPDELVEMAEQGYRHDLSLDVPEDAMTGPPTEARW
jgi:uncharacterized protein